MLNQVMVSLVIMGAGWIIISAIQSGIAEELRPVAPGPLAVPGSVDWPVRAGGRPDRANPGRIAAVEGESEGGAVRRQGSDGS
jgi:hypothetical protein